MLWSDYYVNGWISPQWIGEVSKNNVCVCKQPWGRHIKECRSMRNHKINKKLSVPKSLDERLALCTKYKYISLPVEILQTIYKAIALFFFFINTTEASKLLHFEIQFSVQKSIGIINITANLWTVWMNVIYCSESNNFENWSLLQTTIPN